MATKKQALATTPRKWFRWIASAIICVTAFSLYYKSAKNDFLDLDDMTIIVRNYNFLKDASNAGQVFRQGAFQIQGEKDTLTSYYRPMMILSFMLDAQLSPKKTGFPVPGPFLKANIFYHIAACLLLFFLLLELKIPDTPALLLTLIFAAHPLLNQAIAWIPGRNDSLLTIFIISSFIFLLRYIITRKNYLLVFHVVFFLLALFTKENALLFVPLVLIYLRFIQKGKIALKTYLLLSLGYLLCIVPWLIMRHVALATNTDRSTLHSFSHTLLYNTPFFIQYLSKSILPFNLSVMSIASDTNYSIGLVVIGLLLAGIVLSKKKNTALVIFGICWFFFFLSPSFLSSFSGLEHRAYLPLVGIFVSVSQFGIFKNADYRSASMQGKIGFGILVSIFLVFFYVSHKRLSIFQNRYTFDESAMETSPNSVAPCLYLAAHYEEELMFDKAIAAYREALKRDSTNALARGNLAGDYIRQNKYADAEKELRIELRQHPDNQIATFNLGLVVFQGDTNFKEGVRLWKKAVSMDSSFTQPYKVLFQYYQAIGDSGNTVLYRNLYYKKLPK